MSEGDSPPPLLPSLSSDMSVKSSSARPDANAVKVVARFRPLSEAELESGPAGTVFAFPGENSVVVADGPDGGEYTFDCVFRSEAEQEKVYEIVGKPVIEDVLIGFNGTIFAYGQTGSGKTFTMMGPDIADPVQKGIIPRAAAHIFAAADEFRADIEWSVKCSILEIYNEKVQDLLNVENTNLQIKETASSGIYVEGLTAVVSATQYIVSDLELLDVLDAGLRNRTVAMTKMNQASSRSHELVILEVSQKLPSGLEKAGRLNLVDLAGSEKASAHSKSTGETFEEMKKINLSLSALGKVIKALIAKSPHVPYRDSKLTRLLQESLGGNYKTALVITCSPHKRNLAETMSTLRFGQRAKSLKNHAHVNIKESADSLRALVNQLKEELAVCRGELNALKGLDTSAESRPMRTLSTPRRGSLVFDSVVENNEELIVTNADLKERVAELEDALQQAKKEQHATDEKLVQMSDEHFAAVAFGDELKRTNEALMLQVELLEREVEALRTQVEYLESQQKSQIEKFTLSFARSEPPANDYNLAMTEFKQSLNDRSSIANVSDAPAAVDSRVKLSQAEMSLLTLQTENSALKWRLKMIEMSEKHKASVIELLQSQNTNQLSTFKRIQSSFSRLAIDKPIEEKQEVSGPKAQFVRKMTRNALRVINSKVYKVNHQLDVGGREPPTPTEAAVEGKFQLQEMANDQLRLSIAELTDELQLKSQLLADFESQAVTSQLEVAAKWSKLLSDLKDSHEQQLAAREKLVATLMEQIAGWVDRYQGLMLYSAPSGSEAVHTEPCETTEGLRQFHGNPPRESGGGTRSWWW